MTPTSTPMQSIGLMNNTLENKNQFVISVLRYSGKQNIRIPRVREKKDLFFIAEISLKPSSLKWAMHVNPQVNHERPEGN